MVYGSETWAMKVEDMRRLERAERMMVRWMCGVTLKERKHSEELLARLGIEGVAEIVRRGRLRWYGHVERLNARDSSKRDWVSACREITVEGSRGRGRGRKIWKECVDEDMKRLRLKNEEVHNHALWRSAIMGHRLNSASAETQT